MSLSTLDGHVLGVLCAALPQRDAIRLTEIATFFKHTYPRSVTCTAHQDLKGFLRWVGARGDIEDIDVTVDPHEWNRLAPDYLRDCTFKNVTIFPFPIRIHDTDARVWIPKADTVRSGFFGPGAHVREIDDFLTCTFEKKSDTIELPYFRESIANFRLISAGSIAGIRRIPDIDVTIMGPLKDDDLRHIATFTKTVRIQFFNTPKNVFENTRFTFQAHTLSFCAESVRVIERAPMCEHLSLRFCGDTEILQLVTSAKFPRLKTLVLCGFVNRSLWNGEVQKLSKEYVVEDRSMFTD